MLENEKIIVQDHGIDAGLAALLQNTSKGSFDPSTMMALMNNNGFGNGSWWWIFIIVLFWKWSIW